LCAAAANCDASGDTTANSGAGPTTSTGGGGSGAGGGNGGFNNGGAAQVFPEEPIIDGGAPSNAPTLFGDPSSGDPTGGPCLIEPEPDTLLPNNWLRPRFRMAAGAQNLFEIRLSAASQDHDLVVYTDALVWAMPAALWYDVAASVVDEPITVSVRGAVFDGTSLTTPPALGSRLDMRVAPVAAEGTIVYWSTTGGSSLKGFTPGQETVTTVLVPSQVAMPTSGGEVACIGCHTSTPDGLYASFTAQSPWANALGSIQPAMPGATPPYLSAAAAQALSQPVALGIHSYSPAHFSAGDRVMITPYGDGAASELAWFDLEAAAPDQGVAFDFLARTGDGRGAGSPSFSRDGNSVVYVSTDAEFTGRLDTGEADLFSVPYNDRLGGNATGVPGASEAGRAEYYPAHSADDALIAFNRFDILGGGANDNMYDQPRAELYVIDSAGGTPTRLAANDPAACTGVTSPGVTNSWPKWSPEVGSSSGRQYYWMIFSSRREGGNPQLYMTGVVVNANGETSTYGAVYLWNQPAAESNHTPAWDVFQIGPPR
jgi:hypothetical protein